jgi:uncharacterized damage-inducible protein DinB
LEKLRYPIGKFLAPKTIDEALISKWLNDLESLPQRLEQLVAPLSESQLDTRYRPEGWTVRQVVHHIADSHHHSYIRFKWGMTENNPVIKPYDEKEWSNLHDAVSAPIGLSLNHLAAVHAKLVYFLWGLNEDQLNRTFTHPDGNRKTTLKENIGRYVWHGNHHMAHIRQLVLREGW